MKRKVGGGNPEWKLVLLISVLLVAPMARGGAVDVRRDATVEAIERVMPSVVNISTETVVEIRDPLEQIFRDFFDPYYRRRPHAQRSLGSGVIIDEEGYILTNFHVVRRANRITVTLWDGREYQARPLVAAARSDVALLKIIQEGDEKFSGVRFAAEDDVILGETVLALGNPFGLGGSVSRGILSSKTRRPPIDNEPLEIADWLQTDAAINPGNSGGPLINLRGELMGLNVAVFREGQGIGFAIPVKRVSEALSEIFTPEAMEGLWFGARLASREDGLVVASVQDKSPAQRAGLEAGDRLLRIAGNPAGSALEANRALMSAGAGREIELEVQRGGVARLLKARLIPEREVFNANLIRERLGASVQDLTPELAEAFSLGTATGVLVAGVDANSPADLARLRRGAVIQAIDRVRVRNTMEAAKVLDEKEPGESVLLEVYAQRRRGRLVETYLAPLRVTLR